MLLVAKLANANNEKILKNHSKKPCKWVLKNGDGFQKSFVFVLCMKVASVLVGLSEVKATASMVGLQRFESLKSCGLPGFLTKPDPGNYLPLNVLHWYYYSEVVLRSSQYPVGIL